MIPAKRRPGCSAQPARHAAVIGVLLLLFSGVGGAKPHPTIVVGFGYASSYTEVALSTALLNVPAEGGTIRVSRWSQRCSTRGRLPHRG